MADYIRCREIFGNYVRSNLKKKIFFKALPEKTTPLTHDELIEKADRALGHIVEPCGIPYDFKGEPIDWFYNATSNGYKEWTWQLSRHAEVLTLARAYLKTKEEKYAEKCCELLSSWIKQAIRPLDDENPNSSLCWRTIECGIRMSLVWPEIIHSILESPAFNDNIITDLYKSVYEHAEIIRNFYTIGNWLIMEMSGLLHIGLIYPCFKRAEEWLSFAEQKLIEELKLQVYPDGFHYELSSEYQHVLVVHYGRIIRILIEYGRKVPEKFKRILYDLLYVYIKLIRPSGELPNLNDGTLAKVSDRIQPYYDLFPENSAFQWAASGGKEGIPPVETSFDMPYAGYAVFRSGWGKDDVWVCFDGGPFGRSHHHEDKLNLLLHSNGRYILTEGNNYAYDNSEMRRYVLSTRAHNTVLVDGMEQNRGASYEWKKSHIEKHSGMVTKLSDYVDYASAVYDEGYGGKQDKTVTHKRSVYFIKGIKELSPFVLVVDRLSATEGIHQYEVQWHLDAENIVADKLNMTADSFKIFVSNKNNKFAELSVEKGVTVPEWNGWTADSVVQDDYRSIYIVKHILHGQNLRWVTLLYPENGSKYNISKIEASCEIEEAEILIRISNGNIIKIDENDLV